MGVEREGARVLDVTTNERARMTSLRGDGTGARVVAYVPPELAQALRVRCVEDRRSLSDAVTEAIRLLLDGQGARDRKRIVEARDRFIAEQREAVRRLDEAEREEETWDAREAREGAVQG
jgi:hypothetical protein